MHGLVLRILLFTTHGIRWICSTYSKLFVGEKKRNKKKSSLDGYKKYLKYNSIIFTNTLIRNESFFYFLFSSRHLKSKHFYQKYRY